MSKDIHVLTYNIHKGYCSGNRRFVLESMRARIPDLQDVVLVPEAGHFVQMEQADAVNAALLAFLRSLPARSVQPIIRSHAGDLS